MNNIDNKGYIYQIRNILNDKRYIGSSIEPDRRFSRHKSSLKCGKHHSMALQRAWEKYGETNFVFEIIKEASYDNLLVDEQIEINKWDFNKELYNVNPIAQNPPHKVGEDHGESKLTWEEVKQIRLLYANEEYDQKGLAKKFNISQIVIWQVIHNTGWHDPEYKPKDSYLNREKQMPTGVDHHNAIFTEEQVKSIRQRYNSENIGLKELAKQYNTSITIMSLLIRNKSYYDSEYKPSYDAKEKRNSKINWDIVRQIRKEREETKLSHQKLAEKYGVARQTILGICNNKTWIEEESKI